MAGKKVFHHCLRTWINSETGEPWKEELSHQEVKQLDQPTVAWDVTNQVLQPALIGGR